MSAPKRSRMFSGQFRHKVLVERQVRVDDDLGGFTTSYATVGTVWCEQLPLSYGERFYQGQVEHTEDFDLLFRAQQTWSLDPREADQLRITFQNAYYRVRNISAVDARNEYIKLRATKDGATASVTPVTPPAGQAYYDGTDNYDGAINYG